MKDEAGREAAYRFLSNRRVTLARVLEPHIEATVERCREARKVLVISDTTEFSFSTAREGMGFLSTERQPGFLGHFSLAVSADGRRTPLGILNIEAWTRSSRKGSRDHFARKKDPQRESLRWERCAFAANEKLEKVEAIHVMDREADIYELMAGLRKAERRFIIRSGQDRLLEDGRLFETLSWTPIHFRREVKLSSRTASRHPESRRSHPPRDGRVADLAVAASRVCIKKPKTCVDEGLPQALELSVVRVWEPSPPDGQEPVEWRLFTTESVATQEEIEGVVDAYRARWVIEEYFKALKTGCGYERSQLESLDALKNFLAICAPVAWQLLLLRSIGRDAPTSSASRVFSDVQLKVLRLIALKPLPPSPTVADAIAAIARLGAHIKSNGPPGWQVLGRGFQELRRAENLHKRMISTAYCDQS
jgi:hypothetical protein